MGFFRDLYGLIILSLGIKTKPPSGNLLPQWAALIEELNAILSIQTNLKIE